MVRNELRHEHESPENVFEGFVVDPYGGYVTSLQDSDGAEILYDRRMLNGKLRGGSHVCLPQFGPDSTGLLNQHGFGRNRVWLVKPDNETTARLEMLMPDEQDGDFEGLKASIRYSHQGTSFDTQLSVRNEGDHEMPVAPGFHPYFATANGKVVLNGQQLDLEGLKEAHFISGSRHELEVNGRTLVLNSLMLKKWAIWTDNPAEYICIEPTLVGAGFSNSDKIVGDIVAPGQDAMYGYKISW